MAEFDLETLEQFIVRAERNTYVGSAQELPPIVWDQKICNSQSMIGPTMTAILGRVISSVRRLSTIA